ncbi:TRAP transporter small permease subunit [Thiopseudomonas alkaliphila]|nr:TRAP transporter small permease subunit [Thiopseudomonas alkaliphila]
MGGRVELIGASLGHLFRHGLCIELVAERFGRLGRQISEWLGLIVIAACALLIIVLSVESLLESLAQQRASASLLVLPSWLVELSLPIGFSLLLVQALLHMLQLVKQPITAEPRP